MRKVDFALIGGVWGTRDELARDRYSRTEFEKRVFVASCYLGWADYRIVSDRPAVGGGRAVMIESTARGTEQRTALRLEENSSGRWFVAAADLSGLSPVHCG